MATARLPVVLLNGPVYVGAAGDERIVGYVNDLDDPSRRHPVELHALAGGQTVHGYPVGALVPLSRPGREDHRAARHGRWQPAGGRGLMRLHWSHLNQECESRQAAASVGARRGL